MVVVVKYTSDKKEEWDSFIKQSKNGTFLFNRGFMEYHRDRFTDSSLMIYRKGELISCFPANVVKDEVHSHQGLTYGGFVFNKKMRMSIAEQILESVMVFYKSKGVKRIFIKQIPPIYHKLPANEMDYWLWLKGAEVYRKDTTFTVSLSQDLNFSKRKIRYNRKAETNNLIIKQVDDLSGFWNKVLITNLKEKYETQPVHSLNEISLLRNDFPNNIKQFNVYSGDSVVAGTTVFLTETTAHAQYISTNEEGAKYGALDFLFINLMKKYREKGYEYFDFGISNENAGKNLNYSLAEYKEGFGANVFVQEFYKLDL